MNKQIEALKMAIEAMSCISQSRGEPLLKAIRACKEALAEAEKQEWQSLNNDEIYELERPCVSYGVFGDDVGVLDPLKFARAIEQALKEKNHDLHKG